MNYRPLLLLTVVTLTACEVGAAPSSPNTDEADGAMNTPINPTAGLNAYPGATGSEVIPDGVDTRTRFGSDASLQEVYSYFDGQLTAQGWGQTSIENEDDEVEAEYTREGRELEFELERDDGGFELEIDIGGDNASYDQDNGAGDDDSDDGSGDDNDDDGDDGSDG